MEITTSRVPLLSSMCTHVASQSLVRDADDETCAHSEYERRISLCLRSQLEQYEMVRGMSGRFLFTHIVQACPNLLTDKLLLLLLPRDVQQLRLRNCSCLSVDALACWVSSVAYDVISSFLWKGVHRRTKLVESVIERTNIMGAGTRKERKVTTVDLSGCENLNFRSGVYFATVPGDSLFVRHFIQPICTTLISLDISRTSITNEDIQGVLLLCSELQSLDMSSCGNVTPSVFDFPEGDLYLPVPDADSTPSAATNTYDSHSIAKNLRVVDLSACDIADFTIRQLAFLCQGRLEVVRMAYCSPSLTKLSLLYLAGYELDMVQGEGDDGADGNPASINVCGKLFESRLVECDIRGLHHARTKHFDLCLETFYQDSQISLKSLVIDNEHEPHLKHILRTTPHLEKLTVYGVRLCTEDTLAFFTQRAHNLRQLVVGGSPFLDGTALRKVCRSGQQPWERLHVAECPLTDDDANYLSLLIGDTIESFELGWCDALTDVGISHVIRNCKQLKKLQLRTINIGPETLDAIAQHAPLRLEFLGLESSGSFLCDDHFPGFAQAFPLIRDINLSWNISIGDDAIRSILTSCLSLEVLTLAGVKRITVNPFMPLVNILIAKPHSKTRLWCLSREAMVERCEELLKFKEVTATRSPSYARNLKRLDVTYCDHVDDTALALIAQGTYHTLRITNYYNEDVSSEREEERSEYGKLDVYYSGSKSKFPVAHYGYTEKL